MSEPIAPGASLSHYRIGAKLGAGGMGEVYRATDTRLGREVAVKVLPELFTSDAERLARFRREAQILAALSHPSIAGIYGFEDVNGQHLLVLELAEGEDLSDRIARGPMALDEALPIALQIAQALEAAHDKGVIHRDLKPANVKVSADGKVKVLDFGLAKALEGSAAGTSSPAVTQSPTLSAHATAIGVLLGTAAYMSPEQARGRAADKRADVWAFGVVLHEMLSGERAFRGETISDTLAAVLRADLPWSKLPADTPAVIRRLLVRCLQRDLQKRLPDIGAARLDIQELLAGGAPEVPGLPTAAPQPSLPAWRRRLPWGVAAALVAATALLARQAYLLAHRPQPVIRASIPPPEGTTYWLDSLTPGPPTLSPDGKALAFSARDTGGVVRLWVRSLETGDAHALTGADGAQYPFWSSDGRAIGFFADSKLKTIEAAGGPPVTLCAAEDGKGGTWSPSGVIVFAPSSAAALWKVAAGGGEPTPITRLDEKRGDSSHRHPRFLPDGKRFLYLARAKDVAPEGSSVVVGSLEGGPETLLLRSTAAAAYSSGHLLFLRERTLMARPFDPVRLTFTGDAVPLAESILLPSLSSAVAVFSAQNGVLVFQTQRGISASKLEWVARDGKVTGTLGEPAQYAQLAVSPDGKLAAVGVQETSGSRDLWMFDIARSLRTRFTFDAASEYWPLFSPDGRWLVYASAKKGPLDIYRKAVNGTGEEELLLESTSDKIPSAISPDGSLLVYSDDSKETKLDIWVLPLSGPDRKPRPILKTPFIEYAAALSPDGRYLVYGSDESGKFELYLTTFPEAGRKWQISREPGGFARWSKDGSEIVYHGLSGQLWAVAVSTQGGDVSVGAATPLFKMPGPPSANYVDFVPSADHKQFLVRAPNHQNDPLLSLVVNWPAAHRARGE